MCPTVSPPVHTSGTLLHYDGDSCRVELSEPDLDIPEESRTVLSLSGRYGLRILGVVESSEDNRLSLRVLRVQRKDKRDYPRMSGNVDMRYRTVQGTDNAQIQRMWLSGLSDANDPSPWYSPDPFMNFSGSGVRFRDAPTVEAEDQLLIELTIPSSEKSFRLIGTVVRVEPGDESAEDDRTHFVAVRFNELPSDATEALTRFTLELQLEAMSTDE
jgi:c-di-GMP-binding flagellar brake protein YcgR